MIRDQIYNNRRHDPNVLYRGATASRLDNLTDAVFGIAITLLIFNLSNPNSFEDLLRFTKTLPAFLISITFIFIIWKEHLHFSEMYTLDDSVFQMLNTIFIALIIFYVYPLRFWTLFLTNLIFQTDVNLNIRGEEVPDLMVYYGFVAFALYFVLYLFYLRALRLKKALVLSEYEIALTRWQKSRLVIMFSVPLISIGLTLIVKSVSPVYASMAGGFAYFLYTPLIFLWYRRKDKKLAPFRNAESD